ncbi:hypothetical protein AAG570_005250 [Ranatra chinensis]|uniref:Uncharacterized protein n=1 Tax=Ranatra chinensis TaxID=642074 RepID=A0ABD0YCL5_9HEMI
MTGLTCWKKPPICGTPWRMLVFSAGILQGALFTSTRSMYMNYGTFGFVEITHRCDDMVLYQKALLSCESYSTHALNGGSVSYVMLFDRGGKLRDRWDRTLRENTFRRRPASCTIMAIMPTEKSIPSTCLCPLHWILGGKRFPIDDEVRETLEKWLSEVERSVFDGGIKKLVLRPNNCI